MSKKINGQSESNLKPVSQVRPWVRFWARHFDLCLSASFFSIIWEAFGPAISMKWVIHCMLYVFLWVPIETVLLSTWGTTPGKWLMNTRVTDATGKRLRFTAALGRSMFVWSWGMGIGFPYASWVGEMFSYLDLRNQGITRWDSQGGFLVSHERIGSHRFFVAILLNALLVTLLGFAANAMANSQNVSLTVGLLALLGLAISWLLIIDLATAEES